jgi:hypothetical protein
MMRRLFELTSRHALAPRIAPIVGQQDDANGGKRRKAH